MKNSTALVQHQSTAVQKLEQDSSDDNPMLKLRKVIENGIANGNIGCTFASLGLQINDAKTPQQYLKVERRQSIGSVSPEALQNVAELYETDAWRALNYYTRKYKHHFQLPPSLDDIDDLGRQIKWLNQDLRREGEWSLCRFEWRGDIDSRNAALRLLEERKSILADDISYADEFACDIGIKGECPSYEKKAARACFECDYNVFHGVTHPIEGSFTEDRPSYPKAGPFTEDEGKALVIARCIEEAKKWGYGQFRSKPWKHSGIWVSEKNGRTAVIQYQTIRSNICDDSGFVVFEVDEESARQVYAERLDHTRRFDGDKEAKKFAKKYTAEDFRYCHIEGDGYRRFEIVTSCTGPIV